MTDESMDVRERILRAATDLLARGGREAVSTRAVSAAARVQAPTIYRQFGDMHGLLQVVAGDILAQYVQQKRVLESTADPIADLRRGWEHHVAFGVGNAAAYLFIYSDATRLAQSPAQREGQAILRQLITRVAESGRLGVSIDHAVRMISAACRGVALSLIGTPAEERDAHLSHDTREAVISAITVAPAAQLGGDASNGVSRVAARAVSLRAVLASAPAVLSSAEQHLLGEWLDRLSAPTNDHGQGFAVQGHAP